MSDDPKFQRSENVEQNATKNTTDSNKLSSFVQAINFGDKNGKDSGPSQQSSKIADNNSNGKHLPGLDLHDKGPQYHFEPWLGNPEKWRKDQEERQEDKRYGTKEGLDDVAKGMFDKDGKLSDQGQKDLAGLLNYEFKHGGSSKFSLDSLNKALADQNSSYKLELGARKDGVNKFGPEIEAMTASFGINVKASDGKTVQTVDVPAPHLEYDHSINILSANNNKVSDEVNADHLIIPRLNYDNR